LRARKKFSDAFEKSADTLYSILSKVWLGVIYVQENEPHSPLWQNGQENFIKATSELNYFMTLNAKMETLGLYQKSINYFYS
jgi:hypothetical protein